jgi:hypothetical protein
MVLQLPHATLKSVDEFFDPTFLAELEELAAPHQGLPGAWPPVSSGLQAQLQSFLASDPHNGGNTALGEEDFVALPNAALADRINTLIEICRKGGQREALLALENFVVFFQALVPTLPEAGAEAVKRLFFHLVPTLIHIAYNDFAEAETRREEGVASLRNLETILIEISNIRLAPSETDLVFRSIDQMAAFIGVGEYAMASEVISSQLLSLIERNKLTRALYRLMEVEVSVQLHLKEKLGYATPQIQLPEDAAALADYGPLRILYDEGPDGTPLRFIQVHLPDIQILKDIVLHLVSQETAASYDLRLDGLGSAELRVPPGRYAMGFAYEPES